jgi:hypothetical protein
MKNRYISLLVLLICHHTVAKDFIHDPVYKNFPVTEKVEATAITKNPNIESKEFANYVTWLIPKWQEIHELYANNIAILAAKNNEKMPSGAIFVSKVYEPLVEHGKFIMDGDEYKKGKFVRIDVMESRIGWGNSNPKGARNDDFHYARFKNEVGNSQIKIDQGQCISCHLSKPNENYIFSLKELTKYAKKR